MKKRILSFVLVLAMVVSMLSVVLVNAAAMGGTADITVESGMVMVGKQINLALDISNNPGISGLILTIKYDKAGLELKEVTNGTVMSTMTSMTNIVFNNTPDATEDGTLAILTFEAKAVGDYTIECVIRECANASFETVNVNITNGVLSVVDFIYGDADGDRDIDINDSILVRKYLAEYDYDTGVSTVSVSYGADANGNGSINIKDAILLNKYLAAFDYDTGSSSIVLGPEKGNGDDDIIDNPNLSGCSHAWSDWKVGVSATCDGIGYDYRECQKCDDVLYDFLPAKGHNWGSMAEIITMPTATSAGKGLAQCTECQLLRFETIEANGDLDGDGLTNLEEATVYNTDMMAVDTDGDGVSDYDEAITYGTDPLDTDTDDDGASDGAEITYGTNPKAVETSFDVDVVIPADEDIVSPGVKVDGITADQLESLKIEKNDTFDENTVGYMGSAYDYSIDGDVDEATIVFEIAATTFSADTPDPVIYYFDAATNSLYPQPTTVVGSTASATVDRFGSYILIDRSAKNKQLTWEDVWLLDGPSSGGEYSSLELVFVIDDSGSMRSNDYSNKRLDVVRDVIDTFGEGAKIGIVRFHHSVNVLTGNSFIEATESGKNTLKGYLTTSYFTSGGSSTRIYSAVVEAAEYYSTPSANDDVLRVMVVLSDGLPVSESVTQSEAISAAKAKGIEIYTVGLGSGQTAFDSCLKPMSDQTGGKYQHASDASALMELYEKIGKKISMTLDTDKDMLPDYYEEHLFEIGGSFSGIITDKNNPDTDGDGLLDGTEVRVVFVYNGHKYDASTKFAVEGKVFSDPTKQDSDGDGILDAKDKHPLKPDKKDN